MQRCQRNNTRYQVFGEFWHFLGYAVQQLLCFLTTKQFRRKLTNQVVEVCCDNRTGLHHGETLDLRLLFQRTLNPDSRQAKGRIDSLLTGDMAALQSSFAHLIWPAMVLSVGAVAIISRMTRSSMLEVLGQDYIRTAAAKGMGPGRIVGGHALKNAAPSIVTIIGLELGQLLGGAVITETIFNWPGIGGYVVESINATDYAPVQAMTLVAAIIYLVVNLLVDLSQGIFDPKVRNA